jgi:rfaE bifunctional protein kinase chain/domain
MQSSQPAGRMTPPPANDPSALVASLAGRRVLVLGDLFMDEYLEGRTERLSREAPVPVVELTRRTTIPGGAANPAHQVVALGGQAVLAGLVGDDEAGHTLVGQLQESGVDTSGVVIDCARSTTLKTRLVAFRDALRFPQHLARVDRLDRTPLEGETLARLLDRLVVLIPTVDVLVVSDYRGGVLLPEVVEAITAEARSAGVWTAVDSQGNLAKYAGFGLIKCNRAEAESELGLPLAGDADYERALARLLPRLHAGMLVITRGPEGMSLQAQGGHAEHLPAANRSEVYDVTGAGDTVIAVLAMALAAHLSLHTAAHLANAAAGVVVRRLGNVAVTPQELVAELTR